MKVQVHIEWMEELDAWGKRLQVEVKELQTELAEISRLNAEHEEEREILVGLSHACNVIIAKSMDPMYVKPDSFETHISHSRQIEVPAEYSWRLPRIFGHATNLSPADLSRIGPSPPPCLGQCPRHPIKARPLQQVVATVQTCWIV